ncbi:MAG TPA: ribonuclease III domain-containing protein, partial [Candidatus Tectomicrobia bacterium]|nr:ribonuclease III domain-containing protein [Candidatus Tectomicrobia bacterium]
MLDAARVAALEARLAHRFADRARLTRAFTHASYAAEHAVVPQDGLAFVGDAALGLIVAEHLLAAEPTAGVGRLTPLRAALVADRRLAEWARSLDL